MSKQAHIEEVEEVEVDEVAEEAPPVDDSDRLRAARSWVRKLVKDAYAEDASKRFGLVHSVEQGEDGVRLLARFPGEAADRRIALEPVVDGHYLFPKDVKSRYRRLSERDVAELKSLSRSAG